MEAGSPTAPKAKGGFVDERHTKFNTEPAPWVF